MSAKILTLQNAEINTVAISIRTLQIEGKQVTLSVFRQLIEEEIVTGNPPTLRGVGWGHVNYLLNGANSYAYEGRPINLIWQMGSDLRRCVVWYRRKIPSFIFDVRPPTQWWPDARPPVPLPESYVRDLAKWEMNRAAAEREHEAGVRFITQRNALVLPLFDLPQLFIAV
jgi:hypothetical protein